MENLKFIQDAKDGRLKTEPNAGCRKINKEYNNTDNSVEKQIQRNTTGVNANTFNNRVKNYSEVNLDEDHSNPIQIPEKQKNSPNQKNKSKNMTQKNISNDEYLDKATKKAKRRTYSATQEKSAKRIQNK